MKAQRSLILAFIGCLAVSATSTAQQQYSLADLGGPGSADPAGSGLSRAFLYSSGTMTDLNTSMDPSSPLALYVTLQLGHGINDNGWIVANGIDSRTGHSHAYLLAPVPLPATRWLLLSALGVLGIAGLELSRAQRGAREKQEIAPGRVIFVNRYFHPDCSATSQMLFDLTQRLVERGIKVAVVCSRQLYEDPEARLRAHESLRGIRICRVWTSRFGRDRLVGRALDYATFYVSAALALFSMARRDDVVVAKTDPPLISIVAALVARLRGAHLVNWLQDVFPEVASHLGANPLPCWLNAALRGLRDRSLAVARVNVVLGGHMRRHIEERRIPRERIEIIENWADGDLVAPKPVEASELRRQLRLLDKFVVAYSGNLGRAHEYETLLHAAEILRHDPAIVFLMIGSGAKMQQLHTEVERCKLQNFRFLPYQPREQLGDALAAADIHLACLLPQLEGLIVPSKFYGILAAGRPTLFVGDCDGEIARVITEARCGAVVQTGDAAALASAVLRLRDLPDVRFASGARARELFTTKYTVKRATEQWLNVIACARGTSRCLEPALPSARVHVAGP